MENLAPEIRGCRFPWEADLLTYHSRSFVTHQICESIFCLPLKVHKGKLSTWVWNEGSSLNNRLCAMVTYVYALPIASVERWKRTLFWNEHWCARYLPQNPAEPKETCRSKNSLWKMTLHQSLSQCEEISNVLEEDEKLHLQLPAGLRDDWLSRIRWHHKLHVSSLIFICLGCPINKDPLGIKMSGWAPLKKIETGGSEGTGKLARRAGSIGPIHTRCLPLPTRFLKSTTVATVAGGPKTFGRTKELEYQKLIAL